MSEDLEFMVHLQFRAEPTEGERRRLARKKLGCARRIAKGSLRVLSPAAPQKWPPLTLKSRIDFFLIKTDDYRTINDDYRSGHVTKFLEIDQRAGVLRNISLLKPHAFLRKILFRLIAEHSPVLGIDNDLQYPPPDEFTFPAVRRWIASLAPPITSRTGPLE